MAFTPYHEFNKSYSTSAEKRQANASWLLQNLMARGMTYNAAVGTIANFDKECTLNPNDPQASTFPNANSAGKYQAFGLPQWDRPSGDGWKDRIGRYGAERGIYPDRTDNNPLADADLQLDYLWADAGQSIYGRYWYQNSGTEGKKWFLSWNDFINSSRDVDDLARIFYWSYERSSGGATSANQRAQLALNWDEYFQGHPIPPTPLKIPLWLLFKFKGRGLKL